MNISGFTVLRDGVSLGYPFVESILSLLPACDEYVISEGYSKDDTYYWLERLQKRYPQKIRLFRDHWPEGVTGGQAIGKIQARTLKRCRSRWAYLLQADEIMPELNLPYLRELCSPRSLIERAVGRRRFNSYYVDFLHIHDNFQRVDFDPGYRWAVRLGAQQTVYLLRRRWLAVAGARMFTDRQCPLSTSRITRRLQFSNKRMAQAHQPRRFISGERRLQIKSNSGASETGSLRDWGDDPFG